jgi:F-type H+-transporting ATPase subunit a
MTEQFLITRLLNAAFGHPVAALFASLGIHPADPSAPIDNTFALELMVTLFLFLFFLAVRTSLNVEKPGGVQQIAEMLHEFVGGQADQIIGHGYERYQVFVTTVFLFVVCNNLLGLIPGLETPTGRPFVPLGIAVLTFLYYNAHGLRAQGPVGYLKHFLGPVWWISWLMLPIEIISHLARMMSLTIRLYANMFASDLLTLVFFSLVPIGIPAVFLGLHFAVSLIQAYVFMLLAMIYLSQAVAHDH